MNSHPIIVQKFGGTSVGNTARIMNITNKVVSELDKGGRVVLVVSAMAGVTNTLLNYCKEISPLISARELQALDFVLSSGENISSGLAALALNKRGINAVPLQGWQIPISTNSQNYRALIMSVNSSKILEYLDQGVVPVICGFQGVNDAGQITTLGRGGSDITAVAVAAAINADRCDIYTDVTGIYTADPRFVHNAKQIHSIAYDQMLELSYNGAKVMHPRSIEIAKAYSLDLRVISSFDESQGTKIEVNNMEQSKIVGVTHNQNILLAKVNGAKNLSALLISLNEFGANINSAFMQGGSVFLIAGIEEFNRLEQVLNQLKENDISGFEIQTDVAVVNVIGTRLLNEQIVIDRILKVIGGFMVKSFSIDHAKVSILLSENDAHDLVKNLHDQLIDECLVD